VLLENEPHGLEIELCGEVEYGKVFVIEGALSLASLTGPYDRTPARSRIASQQP
jgi:hypothetical protein